MQPTRRHWPNAPAIGCVSSTGEATNIKITTPEDLAIADRSRRPRTRRVAQPQRATGRAGTGYDLHRLVDGRPLILGGVTIASERGCAGHSDADVVCHAITDAILGAACLGDIGRHFPDSDPRWKDASSLDLLERTVALVAEQGLEVGNVDVTVILEAPELRGHVDAMRADLARGAPHRCGRVSVKARPTKVWTRSDAARRSRRMPWRCFAVQRNWTDG